MEQSSQQVPFTAQPQMPMAGAFSVSNLPQSANINVDLSFLLDEQALQQQYVGMTAVSGSGDAAGSSNGDTGDLHALARELLNRNGRVAGPEPPPPHTHQ